MLGYVATSLCYACNFDADNVVPAKNLDSRYFAYASCKCPTCGGTSFDTNENKSFAKCVGCGREFSNGYSELVSINRKIIEEQGLSAFINNNVVPAKNLDSRYFAYASCKCPTCGGTSFDTNENKSFAKCVGCGREFSNGYSELVSINRKIIEEQGLSAFINKMVGSMWATNLNDDIFVLEFTDNDNVRFFLTGNPPTTMIGDFHYGKYKLNGDTLTFDFKDDIFGLCIMNGKISNDFLNITGTHKEIDGKVTPIQFPMQKM